MLLCIKLTVKCTSIRISSSSIRTLDLSRHVMLLSSYRIILNLFFHFSIVIDWYRSVKCVNQRDYQGVTHALEAVKLDHPAQLVAQDLSNFKVRLYVLSG